MRKIYAVVLFIFSIGALTLLLNPPSKASAETDGGDIIFKDTGKLAPVLFSHKKHIDAGNKCEDCHDKIFQKKAGSADQGNALTMSALKEGKYCGVGHDVGKAFDSKKNCKQCHVKP